MSQSDRWRIQSNEEIIDFLVALWRVRSVVECRVKVCRALGGHRSAGKKKNWQVRKKFSLNMETN